LAIPATCSTNISDEKIATTRAKNRHHAASLRAKVSLDAASSAADRRSIRQSIALPKMSVCASVTGHARSAVGHSGAISMPAMFIDSCF
jgi:hypothetical protein